MATIFQLSDRLSRPASKPAGDATATSQSASQSAGRPAGRSATIILFTGVRYERWDDVSGDIANKAANAAWAHGPSAGTLQR